MALTPNFIRFQPAVYAYDGTSYYQVRKKWEAFEVMQNNVPFNYEEMSMTE